MKNGTANKLSEQRTEMTRSKETDPFLIYVRELRGRSVNEESHPSDNLPKAPSVCMMPPKPKSYQ